MLIVYDYIKRLYKHFQYNKKGGAEYRETIEGDKIDMEDKKLVKKVDLKKEEKAGDNTSKPRKRKGSKKIYE